MSDKRRFPRRDFVLLPLLCLATLVLLIGIPELIAERAFYAHQVDSCLRPDPVLGDRALPNCHARYKAGEGPWAENDYNECGYRSNESCLSKPADTFRVALLGSSTSMGYLVPYEQTFAARSEKILSDTCGRNVEFQSMGGLGYEWRRLELRFDESLKLQPDLVVATLSPFDMRVPFDLHRVVGPPPQGLIGQVKSIVQESALWRAVLHYRANLPVTYLRFFLRDTTRSDYLRLPFNDFWQQQLGYTKALIDHLAAKSRASKVPLLLVFVPMRSQAVLLKHHADFPDTAPLALDNAVRSFAHDAGVPFTDFTPTLAAAKDMNPLYYAIDDHVTGKGSALLAKQLSDVIVKAHYPGLSNCNPLRAASMTN